MWTCLTHFVRFLNEKKLNEMEIILSIQAHYENKPIQIYSKFYHQNNENFQIKNSDKFEISALT